MPNPNILIDKTKARDMWTQTQIDAY